MLTRETLSACIATATDLAQKGYTLEAIPSTPVYDLNRHTNAALLPAKAAEEVNDPVIFSEYLSQLTRGGDAPSLHDLTLDDYLIDLKNAVTSHLKFAKSVVRPIVMQYADSLKRLKLELDSGELGASAINSFTLAIYDKPELLEDSLFLDELSAYENANAALPREAQELVEVTKDGLLEMLLTGDESIDALIAKWYADNGGYTYFSAFVDSVIRPDADEKKPLDLPSQTNYIVFGYLLNRTLARTAQYFNDRTLRTLAQHQFIASGYCDYFGVSLVKLLKYTQMLTATKMLILEVLPSKRTITVLGEVYRAWLKNGGDNTLLFAVVSMNAPWRTQAQLDEHRERLQSEWRSFELFWNSSSSNRKLEAFRHSAKLLFRSQLNELDEAEKEFVASTHDYYDKVAKKLEAIFDAVTFSDLESLDELALRVVGCARFYYSDAYCILQQMIEAARANPKLKPEEAALISTIYYITDYISDQLYLERN